MAVIGATGLEPVNVLGAYTQGMELGRMNRLVQQQQMAQMEAARQEAELRNYLSSADLSSPEVQNQLLRFGPQGAEMAKNLATMGTQRSQAAKADYEAQSQRLKDMYNLVTSAVDEPSYARVRGMAANMGLDVAQIPEQYDPAFVEQAKNAVLTASERLDAELKRDTTAVQRRQVALAERKQSFEERTANAGMSGMVKPPELQKGERWNPEAGRVEAVEGSDIYIKQSGKHNKDYTALNAINTQRSLATSKIDRLLDPKNTDSFNNLFGGYGAYASRELSGKTANLRSDLESLKNNLKAAGKKIIAGAGPGAIGQITEREWPILEGMIAELRPTMTEEGAREKLQEIRTFLDGLAVQAADEYDTTWGRTQYAKAPKGAAEPSAAPAAPAAAPVKVNSKAELDKLPSGSLYVGPDGKTRRKP